MKATIVKNNDFKTIGFEVTANGRRIFSWGISPVVTMYFIKEVNTNDWITDIFNLVSLKAQINELQSFVQTFFEVAKQNKLEIRSGVDFSITKDKIEQMTRQMENIIANII